MELINRQWLEKCLAKDEDGAKLVDFKCEKLAGNKGLMSEIFMVELHWAGGDAVILPKSAVVKVKMSRLLLLNHKDSIINPTRVHIRRGFGRIAHRHSQSRVSLLRVGGEVRGRFESASDVSLFSGLRGNLYFLLLALRQFDFSQLQVNTDQARALVI